VTPFASGNNTPKLTELERSNGAVLSCRLCADHTTTSGVLFLPDLIFGLLSANPAVFMLVWQTAFQLGRI
jgi:hypothetical protein